MLGGKGKGRTRIRNARKETPTNEPEQPQDTAKDLDDEDLDEEVWVRGVCECGGCACDTDGDAAEEVADTDGEAAPEDREAC